jgi:phthalate 4,5-cis-dihydrodiol dehydrogenase
MARDLDGHPVLRFGIVGLGQAGGQALPALLAHPFIKVTAAADVRQEALEKFERDVGGETYHSVEELSASPNVDVVHIATPHNLHVGHTLAAVERGKHVVLEKPMALDLDDCDRMIEAAEHKGVHLVVDRGSHGFDPPIRKIREIVRSGELGRLRMVNNWHYGSSIYAARTPAELDDPPPVGGIFFRQSAHQIDLLRVIGGGMVRSVRAMTGVWDPERRAVGAFLAYLDFEDGAVASFAYSGYDHFDTDEYQGWVGTYGTSKKPDQHGRTRRSLHEALRGRPETELKAAAGYGGSGRADEVAGRREAPSLHAHWGVTVASCERGDMIPTSRGVTVYDDEGQRQIEVPVGRHLSGYAFEEMYDALVNQKPVIRDGRWGKATLEVQLAMVRSAHERREIQLEHQCPTPD